MKYRTRSLPFDGERIGYKILDLPGLQLSLYFPQWKTSKEREVSLVQGCIQPNGTTSMIGGYIGISYGKDGYHIGSPSENSLLAHVAFLLQWEDIGN